MKTILLLFFLLSANIHYAQDKFEVIMGVLSDDRTEPIVQGLVIASNHNNKFHTVTDFDGKFGFNNLPNGKYELKFVYDADTAYYFTTIAIDTSSDIILFVEQKIRMPRLIACCPSRFYYFPPENNEVDSKEIKESVNKFKALELVEGIDSRVSGSTPEELSFRGARQGDYLQFIDGVKCRTLYSLPASTLKYITVYSGFIPAKYGDTTGGLIISETKSYFDVLNERKQSHY